MRYEIPLRMEADLQAQARPRWPQGIGGGLAAELDGGAAVSGGTSVSSTRACRWSCFTQTFIRMRVSQVSKYAG